jgi:hypothetical protein
MLGRSSRTSVGSKATSDRSDAGACSYTYAPVTFGWLLLTLKSWEVMGDLGAIEFSSTVEYIEESDSHPTSKSHPRSSSDLDAGES